MFHILFLLQKFLINKNMCYDYINQVHLHNVYLKCLKAYYMPILLLFLCFLTVPFIRFEMWGKCMDLSGHLFPHL